ncbi:nascent polypeptide-associated complex protein [Candidatus Woesearchaeota archaeon]|nr:nascent polypeptide-associated complex protein [Candidatus Woesearchaeota archaeon]
MMPGMNPRMMKQAMKRMGIQQQEIAATEVIIRAPEKEIVITEPNVTKVNMMGQDTYQVVGEAQERATDTNPTISEEDVQTVKDQAGVSEEQAKEAIAAAKGDLAEAILKLQGD